MSKVMLVNVTHVEESRVAVLDEGILADYEIETINRTALKGNIYNAVVESVHSSLEAAFGCYEDLLARHPKSEWADEAKRSMIRLAKQLSKHGKPEFMEDVRAFGQSEDAGTAVAAAGLRVVERPQQGEWIALLAQR